ncbi:putative Cytochrome P450 [Quillaja saponaria]|uniref:Cytochrome P450 n=1 Tax=Quillaja saponaria TaxID=32244 RepID=A0AAD7PP02_QUISA|nr:putative Cytochrome P450 [Quillaja saponaria]
MDIFSSVSAFIALSFLFLLLAFSFLILSTWMGKSITDPKCPPVKGTVFNMAFYLHRLYDYQTEVAKTHRTFRLLAPGQSEVYTTDTRNIEHILKTQFDKYSKGKHNQDILTDLFGQGIFTVDGDKWRQQRKLASYEFSTRVLREYSCFMFRRNSAKLIRVISGFSGLVFDIQDVLMRCTLDSIFKVGFGVELNCLEGSNKEGTAFMKAFDDSNALIYWRYVDPSWKLKRFLNIGSEAKLKKNIKVMDGFVHRLIKTKRELLAVQQDYNDKEDILSRFLVESKKDPEKMNDQYLRDIILNFMIAGKDTSAGTLSWFFYMLCKNPLVQEKVSQEVKDVTGSQETESNIDEFVDRITDAALEQMHYLHAALTETLRLYPTVPVDGRAAEADDILPDGYRLKKGDGVYYISYAMGRMTYIWGDDAEEFRPERWLKNGIFQPESPFKFVAFHAGPRICLGKDFAYRQMKILAMALLRFFRFKLADETRKITYRTMLTLQIDGALPLYAVSSTFIGKSINDPKYQPVQGTFFGHLFYFQI